MMAEVMAEFVSEQEQLIQQRAEIRNTHFKNIDELVELRAPGLALNYVRREQTKYTEKDPTEWLYWEQKHISLLSYTLQWELYANNYIFNLLGGKEFTVGKKKKNLFAVNGKFTYYDGRRQTPINLESSREVGNTVRYPESYYTEKLKPYYRFDVGIAYTVNARRSTHSLMFDVQNLTNHFNTYTEYYEPYTDNIEKVFQNGAIPIVNYRVEF